MKNKEPLKKLSDEKLSRLLIDDSKLKELRTVQFDIKKAVKFHGRKYMPISLSTIFGAFKVVKFLVDEMKANIYKGSLCSSIIMLDFARDYRDYMQMESKYEKSLMRDDIEAFPLHEAHEYGKKEIFSYLLEKGANLTRFPKNKSSILFKHVEKRDFEMVKFYIEHGASVTKSLGTFLHFRKKKIRITPLSKAALMCKSQSDCHELFEIVDILLKYNAPPHIGVVPERHANFREKYRPVKIAVRNKNIRLIKYFLKYNHKQVVLMALESVCIELGWLNDPNIDEKIITMREIICDYPIPFSKEKSKCFTEEFRDYLIKIQMYFDNSTTGFEVVPREIIIHHFFPLLGEECSCFVTL